jgi:lysozyme
MSRLRKSHVAAALFATTIGASEGTIQYAYRDPGTHGKPWTICMGATHLEDGSDVKPGDYRTVPQCRALLLEQSEGYAQKMEACTSPEALAAMPDKRYVGFLSFTYNLGPGVYCKSIAPLVNGGHTLAACNKLLVFNRAAGHVMAGLSSRRQRERAYCVEGL